MKAKDSQLLIALTTNNCEALEKLLHQNTNINSPILDGHTPLHIAANFGFADCVRILLQHKADCTAVNENGETPLHLAVRQPSPDTINLLLDAGSSVISLDQKGYLPVNLVQAQLQMLQTYCNESTYSHLIYKMSLILEKMKMLSDFQNQEKKLIEQFSSGLLLTDKHNSNELKGMQCSFNQLHI